MLKNILLILITSITIGSLTGCSLFSSDTEEQDAAVAEEGAVEESADGVAATEESAPPETEEVADTDEEEVVDEYPDDDYGDDKVAATDATSSDLPDQPVEGAQEETLYVDGSDSKESSAVADAPVEEQTSIPDSLTEDSTKTFIPVRKMKKTPYQEGGALINRLYVAREGDTMKSVAEKIYGDSSRSGDLLKWNSHFKGKGLNIGDKVYYSSARNPSDSSQILLFYEEAGIQPSYYSAKNGESIRKVSQSLLGHPRSWMEVWATNDVESKWDMPAGTQLRYWPSGTTAAPMQAAAPVEETQPEEEVMPTDNSAPAETAAVEEQPMGEEPPSDTGAAAASMAQNEEPPPPPPSEATPPPPPPPEAIPTPDAPAEEGGLASAMGEAGGDSMMMAVLGGLLILAALILLVFIRRGRKKAYG